MKRSIEITPLELLAAVDKVTKGENMQKLIKANPAISLVFTVFGAVLVDVLFNEDGGQNNE